MPRAAWLSVAVPCMCSVWPLLQAQDCPAGNHLPASSARATSECNCAGCVVGRYDHDGDSATQCQACPAGQLSGHAAQDCDVPCGPGSLRTGAPWAVSDEHHPCDGSVRQVDVGGPSIRWSTESGHDCRWLIACAPGEAVELSFESFATEENFDYVYVHDGTTASAPLLGERLHGADLPGLQSSSGNAMLVRATSDESANEDGFMATPLCRTCHESTPSFEPAQGCVVCPAGQVDADFNEATACVLCQPGSFQAEAGVAAASCVPCPAGKTSHMGSASETACTDGLSFDMGYGISDCPAGTKPGVVQCQVNVVFRVELPSNWAADVQWDIDGGYKTTSEANQVLRPPPPPLPPTTPATLLSLRPPTRARVSMNTAVQLDWAALTSPLHRIT
jgi:hypothetical protein